MNAEPTGVSGVLVDQSGDPDGLSIRRTTDGEMPPDGPFGEASFEEASYDDAWYDGRWLQSAWPDGASEGTSPDQLPPGLPVALWPEDALRTALAGAPGAGLARIVAEAADVYGPVNDALYGHADDSVDGAGGTTVDASSGVLADLSDEALGDLVVACGRLQSWAAGIQALVVAERAARETNPLAHASLVGQITGELVVTEKEGAEVVVRGESGAQHPTVIAALVAGQIDVKKAHVLLRSATQLTVAERAEAIRRYLPRAPRRTWWWLRTKMLAFAKARHGSAASARAAAQRRSVSLDRAENDMGWLSAYLPAVDAAAVWGVLDDMAHQLQRTAGEDRNLGQLRADSLTGIVTGRLLPADRFADTCEPTGRDGDAGVDEPGAGANDVVRAEGRLSEPAVEVAGESVPVCTCGGRPPVVQEVVTEVIRPVRVTPTRPVVRVTIPASVLLGLDDAPGDLAGFGPIPAETARMIAQDATWQRLVTDPISGVLIDYSTTTYRPGRVLRGAVEARDGTCMFLNCDLPADWCDLDHIEPFDHEGDARGQTNAHNLHALCRRHHLLKTHAGWGVVRDPDTGVTTWTTPTGGTHVRPPTVLDTHVEIDEVDPDTSSDLTLRALTGQSLPRYYRTAGAAADTGPDAGPTDPDLPPF